MPVTITIHDVPEEIRDVLAMRAARHGQSLQEYVRARLIELAEQSDPAEFWDRVRLRVQRTGTRLPAAEILAARDRDRR